jgi:hypothetical protein
MDPLTLGIAALAAVGAFGAKFIVEKAFRPSASPKIEVVTSDGEKTTVEASQLTSAKVEEILHKSATRVSY